MKKRLIITGNTYNMKDTLKDAGFRWNPADKSWYQDFSDEETLRDTIQVYKELGLTTSVKTINVSDPNERKYFVKESWIFNLEAMHDKLWCIENDIEEHRLQFPLTLAGKDIKTWDDFEDLRQECYNLESIAKSRKVTGKEYGRIRDIVSWRVQARYNACMASGMSDEEAGRCFEDI